MRERTLLFLAGAFVLGLAEAAGAGECASGNVSLALELQNPSWIGGSAGLRDPFATIYQESLGLQGLNCSDPSDCPFSEYVGDATCNDLAADPLEDYGRVQLGEIPTEPIAFTEIAAELLPNARWGVAAQGFITPAAGASHDVALTYATFRGGFRDVLDVSSDATTPQSLLIDVVVGRGDGLEVGCFGDVLVRRGLVNDLRFRVRADPADDGQPGLVVNADWDYGTIGLGHNVFPVEVNPDSTLWLDVYVAAGPQATGYNVFDECPGGHATFDMRLDSTGTERDGIQVFLTPAPTLTVTSRGGLTYEPVREPGSGAAAIVSAGAISGIARRRASAWRRSKPRRASRAM